MTGNSELIPAPDRRPEDSKVLEELRGLLTLFDDEDPLVASRKFKAAAEAFKTLTIKRQFDAMVAATDQPIDLAGEERLREDLLRRMDALAAQIAEAENLEYPESCRPRLDGP